MTVEAQSCMTRSPAQDSNATRNEIRSASSIVRERFVQKECARKATLLIDRERVKLINTLEYKLCGTHTAHQINKDSRMTALDSFAAL
jgi:hypothetical protein